MPIKTKNSSAKLRRQPKNILDRLDTEKRANNILNQEVKRLKDVLDIQQKKEAILNDQLRVEANRTSSLTNSLMEIKEEKDSYFEQWIKDHSKIKTWKRVGYTSITLNILGLLILIVKDL